MPIQACRHCGVRVLLQADGTCPHCGIPDGYPVTGDDLARIARNNRELAERSTRRRDVRVQRARSRVLGLAALAVVGCTAIVASFSTTGDQLYLFFGLVIAVLVGTVGAALGDLLGPPYVPDEVH